MDQTPENIKHLQVLSFEHTKQIACRVQERLDGVNPSGWLFSTQKAVWLMISYYKNWFERYSRR